MTWCSAAVKRRWKAICRKLEGKHLVKVVCMDLATVYRALVRKHFPQARIVADRFHVIRAGESSLPGLLEGSGSGRREESGSAVADAASPAQSEAGAACATVRLSGERIRRWN